MHKLIYQHPDHGRVILTVPWGPGSGMIPPPTIAFFLSDRTEAVFSYVGSE